jgi:hypothetical protein
MNKSDVKKWISTNTPMGFITENDNEISLDENSNFILKSDIEIIDDTFKENSYVLIFSNEDLKPTLDEINYIFTFCKLKKVRRGILVQISEKIEEIDFTLDGIHIRNINFNKTEDIQEAGNEFSDELFDE